MCEEEDLLLADLKEEGDEEEEATLWTIFPRGTEAADGNTGEAE